MQGVFETFGDQQTDAGAFAFEHRIGRNRGAVQDQRYLGRRNAGLAANEFYTRGDAHRLILRRRWRLGLVGPLGALIMKQQIRESAAHVDAKPHTPILQKNHASELKSRAY